MRKYVVLHMSQNICLILDQNRKETGLQSFYAIVIKYYITTETMIKLNINLISALFTMPKFPQMLSVILIFVFIVVLKPNYNRYTD